MRLNRLPVVCDLKLETTPLRVVVSYAYLVFSQPPAGYVNTETILHFFIYVCKGWDHYFIGSQFPKVSFLYSVSDD